MKKKSDLFTSITKNLYRYTTKKEICPTKLKRYFLTPEIHKDDLGKSDYVPEKIEEFHSFYLSYVGDDIDTEKDNILMSVNGVFIFSCFFKKVNHRNSILSSFP